MRAAACGTAALHGCSTNQNSTVGGHRVDQRSMDLSALPTTSRSRRACMRVGLWPAGEIVPDIRERLLDLFYGIYRKVKEGMGVQGGCVRERG